MGPVRVLVAAQAALGECTLWCEREQALFWTDIDGALLSRRSADGRLTQWRLPAPLGSFALTDRPGVLLLGLATCLALFELDSERLGPLCPVPGLAEGARINDGRCDPQGRFVFGLFNPAGTTDGRFYRVDAQLRIETLPLPLASVGNCLSFSPDGGTLYFTDSPTRRIFAADYHADGAIGAPRLFTALASDDGEPDGATVDAEGCLWVALWGAGCVVRFDPQGRELRRLPLPSSHPTCPAFGGPALDQLIVSSARKALQTPAALAAEPLAGALYQLDAGGVQGRPEHRFRIASS